MASVVIVHAAEDTPPARALAEKLRQMGLQPVVEQTGEALHSAMRGAKAMVALWSPRSATSNDLVEEVKLAKGMGPVIHARMQNAPTPADFSSDASIDLTGWRGEDGFPAWQALANAVAKETGVTVPPPAAPRPSPFFQPGPAAPGAAAAPTAVRPAPVRPAPVSRPAPTPPPRMAPRAEYNDRTGLEPDERRGGSKLAIIGAITFLVVAALGSGGYFAWSQMQGSQASASAWEHLDKTSPAQLRAFLQDNPGSYRDQAQGVLTELEQHRWSAARSADTVDALNAFLNDFPHSDHALEARGRIAELQSAPATTTPIPDSLTDLPPATTDPDLVPPGATAPQTPAPAQTTTPGPVTLTPPPETQAPAPQDQPVTQ